MMDEQKDSTVATLKVPSYTPHLSARRHRSPSFAVRLLHEQSPFDIANTIVTQVVNVLPPEVQESVSNNLSIDQGYTDKTEAAYKNLLSDLKIKQRYLPLHELLLLQEVEHTIDIVSQYIKLIQLNRQYNRLSVFLPLTYTGQYDALDPINYVFDNVSKLVLKNHAKDIVANFFRGYVEGKAENGNLVPLLPGVQREIIHLLKQYEADNGKVLYPCEKFLLDIVNPKKIDAILTELRSFLSDKDVYLVQIFEAQIKEYTHFIHSSLLPHAPKENIIPTEIYRTLLTLEGINEEPEALIKRGHQDFDTLYVRYRELAREVAQEKGLNTDNPTEVLAILEKQDSIVEPDKIVELYMTIQSEIEKIIEQQQLITLPKNKMNMRVGTPAEESILPVPHVNTPSFLKKDINDWPEFVLCDLASNGNSYVAYPLVVHEGRPGHDLQFSRLIEDFLNKKANLIETFISGNSTNVEGWAHYVEYLMMEHYPSKGEQLAAIRDQLLRIARLFLDPELNTQLIDYDDAKEFIQHVVGFSEECAISEADRYCFKMPGQATAYRYGAMKIMDFRKELEKGLGDKFNLKYFHDTLISFGLLPIDISKDFIREKMIDRVYDQEIEQEAPDTQSRSKNACLV